VFLVAGRVLSTEAQVVFQVEYESRQDVPMIPASERRVKFIGIVGTQRDDCQDYPTDGSPWTMKGIKEQATFCEAVVECHSLGELEYEIDSGLPVKLVLTSIVDRDLSESSHVIKRGPSTLSLTFEAHDVFGDVYQPWKKGEARLIFTGPAVQHLKKAAQKTLRLEAGESSFTYECNASTQFGTTANLECALEVKPPSGGGFAPRAKLDPKIEFYAPPAQLVFCKKVKKKLTPVGDRGPNENQRGPTLGRLGRHGWRS
jgi:hypothetical protein